MAFDQLSAISPVDGRYRSKTAVLAAYFSESALIRYRIRVEVEYFLALCALPLPQLADFPASGFEVLRSAYLRYTDEAGQKVKNTEKVTNHDVKAVEYYLKDFMEENSLGKWKEFVHFGLTSQDVNNTSIPLSLKEAMLEVYLPAIHEVLATLNRLADEWKDIPMLARTHGQPASPTRLGKEVRVFAERLQGQLLQLNTIPYSAKFGGATGNFNAHHVAYPQVNWPQFGDAFVNEVLGLQRSKTTTQIEHYDNLAALLDAVKRINTILIDLNRDFWLYISMDYFKQRIKEGEVGSSAMPHKVNPIDFENSEGNLGVANAMLEHLSAKLPVSRLQRDLTDSTVLRNLGVPIAHGLVSLIATKAGLEKLLLNEAKIRQDLEDNWAVIAEAVQTILRREAYPNPYETLKQLTRTNARVTKESMNVFIDGLDVREEVKAELRLLSPFNYTGIS
jgi:adenylosuccinate lyase